MTCERPELNENVPCETCGRFGAYEFDGTRLCVDCCEKRGSCCPEFGADDLWRNEETPPPPNRVPPRGGSAA